MILKIFRDGMFSRAINMERITKIVVESYNGEDIKFIKLIDGVERVAIITLPEETKDRLKDYTLPNPNQKCDEAYRKLAENIVSYWTSVIVHYVEVDISDKYSNGYSVKGVM